MIANRIIKSPAVAVFLLLLLVSLALTWLIVNGGLSAGIMILLFTVGLMVVLAVVTHYRIGFYLVFLMGVFMFYVDRVLSIEFPMGTLYDGLVALAFIAVFFAGKHNDWHGFRNPVTITFIILIA